MDPERGIIHHTEKKTSKGVQEQSYGRFFFKLVLCISVLLKKCSFQSCARLRRAVIDSLLDHYFCLNIQQQL